MTTAPYPRPRAKTSFEIIRTVAACLQLAVSLLILARVYGLA